MKNNKYTPKIDWKYVIISCIAATCIGGMIMIGIIYTITNELTKKAEQQKQQSIEEAIIEENTQNIKREE